MTKILYKANDWLDVVAYEIDDYMDINGEAYYGVRDITHRHKAIVGSLEAYKETKREAYEEGLARKKLELSDLDLKRKALSELINLERNPYAA